MKQYLTFEAIFLSQEIYQKYRKTHNEAVFDIYPPDVYAARSAKLLTGLPDAYGRYIDNFDHKFFQVLLTCQHFSSCDATRYAQPICLPKCLTHIAGKSCWKQSISVYCSSQYQSGDLARSLILIAGHVHAYVRHIDILLCYFFLAFSTQKYRQFIDASRSKKLLAGLLMHAASNSWMNYFFFNPGRGKDAAGQPEVLNCSQNFHVRIASNS